MGIRFVEADTHMNEWADDADKAPFVRVDRSHCIDSSTIWDVGITQPAAALPERKISAPAKKLRRTPF